MISPRPPEWNLTVDDLFREMKEGKRASIGQQETDWARDYEVSLIPENYRFPKTGDLYEVVKALEVTFLTHWSAPYTGGGEGMLVPGDRIWLPDQLNEKASSAYAEPVDYPELEQRFVSVSDRTDFNYSGFSIIVKTVDLNEKFKLVETGFKKRRIE